jgi:hypothetical protein
MQTETTHQVDDTTIEQEQADFVRRTAGATEMKIGHDAPASPPPSATDGTSFSVTYERALCDAAAKYTTIDEKCAFLEGVRFELNWQYRPAKK